MTLGSIASAAAPAPGTSASATNPVVETTIATMTMQDAGATISGTSASLWA